MQLCGTDRNREGRKEKRNSDACDYEGAKVKDMAESTKAKSEGM